MTCQTFTHTRASQSKNSFKKYVKQAAMLSISLAAFCSYGSYANEAVAYEENIDSSQIKRVSSPDSAQSTSEIDDQNSYKDLIRGNVEKALSTLDADFNECFSANIGQVLHDEVSFNLEDYLAELDLNMESIVPNVQQKLNGVVLNYTVSEYEDVAIQNIQNAFSAVGFLEVTRTLISEQLLSMKELGSRANSDVIGSETYEKLNEAFQKHSSCIDLIANTRWSDLDSSAVDSPMNMQVGQHSIAITLSNLTTEALGLSGMSLLDKDLTAEAQHKIDSALLNISHGTAVLAGENTRLRCATDILMADDNTDYLVSMSELMHVAKSRAYQSNSDTVSPFQRAMLHEDYRAHLDCVKMLEATYDLVDGQEEHSFDVLRSGEEPSFYELLSNTAISDKRSAAEAIERLTAVSDQYRGQLGRLLASFSSDSGSVDAQPTNVAHGKIG